MLTDADAAAPQVVLIGEVDNVLLDAANNVVALSVRTPPRTIEIAMHESGSGPSRHFGAVRNLVAIEA